MPHAQLFVFRSVRWYESWHGLWLAALGRPRFKAAVVRFFAWAGHNDRWSVEYKCHEGLSALVTEATFRRAVRALNRLGMWQANRRGKLYRGPGCCTGRSTDGPTSLQSRRLAGHQKLASH